MIKKSWCYLSTLVLSSIILHTSALYVHAEEKNAAYKPKDTLSVDNHIGSAARFSFPNDERIHPNTSDFKSVNFVALSSESGERWAAITLINTSSGQRFLTEDHLIGLFANGQRIQPLNLKEKFDGKETRTLNVFFGQKKFPLLDVYTLKDEKTR